MSKKYDEDGLPYIQSEWENISNIPENIQDLSALDSSDDSLVMWDAAVESFVLIELLAENIPYDNSSSGLLAEDVQAAIDEIGLRTVYGGKVAADGTAIALPTGWTSELNSSTYTITHSLGFVDGDAYAVVVTALEGGSHASAQVSSQNSDDFDVVVFDDENNLVTSVPFNFHLVRIS